MKHAILRRLIPPCRVMLAVAGFTIWWFLLATVSDLLVARQICLLTPNRLATTKFYTPPIGDDATIIQIRDLEGKLISQATFDSGTELVTSEFRDRREFPASLCWGHGWDDY